jgi:hypothetical protein
MTSRAFVAGSAGAQGEPQCPFGRGCVRIVRGNGGLVSIVLGVASVGPGSGVRGGGSRRGTGRRVGGDVVQGLNLLNPLQMEVQLRAQILAS